MAVLVKAMWYGPRPTFPSAQLSGPFCGVIRRQV